jgi:alkylation response protein AidB-like acyl-CoA dehydrogenase
MTDGDLRARLRAFLRDHHPGKPPRREDEQFEWRRAWARTLVEHGFAAPSWPRRWYGMALDLPQTVIYHEEMAAARAPGPPHVSVNMVGPTIIQHGTDEQRQRFLLPMLRADEIWCQGFSEPGAGSDLPSLRTRAVRDGDEYIVNGQKVWTTLAHRADWCFCLVRTGNEASRQRGISYLLADMRSPGLEVRPLKTMAGNTHFAELFFTDVRVPVANRVGAENDGWRVTRTTLGHERATTPLAKTVRYRSIVGDLHELARSRGRAGEPALRQRLADMEARARILEVTAQRVLAHALAHGDVGPISSTSRLAQALFEQQMHEVAVDILGPEAMLGATAIERSRGRWLQGFLMTRAQTIGAGTAEIQRNTIAEQVLGLPREPGMPERG